MTSFSRIVRLSFYKLIIINSLITALSNVAIYSLTYYWMGGSANMDAKTQYDHEYVSQAYIDLNYNQGLFLIGVLYAPMLPILWVIMNWFEFMVLVWCLKHFCRLAEKPYESKDANLTLWYLSATWVICAFPAANMMTSPVSYNCKDGLDSILCLCGPFSPGYEMKYYALADFMIAEFPVVESVYKYMLNPFIVYLVILVLAIVIMWQATQLRQVRSQCVDTYMANYFLVRDKQRMIAIQGTKNQALTEQIKGLENALEDKKAV